jgi:lysophospholipase L1-like esterase
LLAFGLIVALIAIEVVLQAAAAYSRMTGRPLATAALTGRPKILCLGDSNTYGVFLPRNQTYPHYLEQIWNRASPTHPVEVLNFGFPGMNSSKLRRNLAGLLEAFHPDIVLVLIGANDPITVPAAVDADEASTMTAVAWRYSRTFRFIYMLVRGVQQYQIDFRPKHNVGTVRSAEREFDFAPEWTNTSHSADWHGDLQKNLRAMADVTRSAGGELMILTYASHRLLYGQANTVIRRASLVHNLPLIDLENGFRIFCPDGECPRIFFTDQHPNAVGYQLVAALAWHALEDLRMAPADDATHAFAQLDPEALALIARLQQRNDPEVERAGSDQLF